MIRKIMYCADLIPRAANGVHNSLRVQFCFREDHGLFLLREELTFLTGQALRTASLT